LFCTTVLLILNNYTGTNLKKMYIFYDKNIISTKLYAKLKYFILILE